jgi:glutamate synthase (NADPH/NADH)
MGSLLTLGAVHHHLLNKKARTKIGIVVETAEARDLHHMTVLLGYGADVIYPYMVYQVLKLSMEKEKCDVNNNELIEKYRKAMDKGVLKVMSKMGISTLQSYKGAKIFEIIGLSEEVVDKCFTGTSSRISGLKFTHLAKHAMFRYKNSLTHRDAMLHNTGHLHWCADGKLHTHEPRTIAQLQQAVTLNRKSSYQACARRADKQSEKCNLRGLFDFKKRRTPISLDDVEPAEDIVKRFVTGAMSYGSISIEAHESLAIAMNSYYLSDATNIQIKIAQGAKPGEGGELPGH